MRFLPAQLWRRIKLIVVNFLCRFLRLTECLLLNQFQNIVMAEIIRRRTIRPSTRGENSPNYRVDITKVGSGDTLIVEVTHESRPYSKTFKFIGKELIKRKTLSFTASEE